MSNYGRAATEYDPFEDDFEAREERRKFRDAQLEHEAWSREQARAGKDALHRTGDATWIRRPDMPTIDAINTSEAAPGQRK